MVVEEFCVVKMDVDRSNRSKECSDNSRRGILCSQILERILIVRIDRSNHSLPRLEKRNVILQLGLFQIRMMTFLKIIDRGAIYRSKME